MPITKGTYIEDLVRESPRAVNVLMKHNVVCIKCGEPVWGTLGETLDRAGMKNQDEIVEELNQVV
jgi:hypothetical protein